MHEKTKTTSLIEIRDFLAAEGCPTPPWSAPERTVDALYRLLRERRDDDRFWGDLEELARRLEDARFDPLPLAEVLGDATVERLLGDLRRSLDGSADPTKTSALTWIGSVASASALTAFLLLGAATGCDSGDGDGDADADVEPDADADADADVEPDADADETCAEAIDLGYTGDAARVYCDLLEIIRAADLTSQTRSQLLECLPGLDAAYRAELIEQFATMSPTQLAEYLDGMTDFGEICGEDAH